MGLSPATKDKLCLWIARRLLPHRLIYWCGVRIVAHATTGHHKKTQQVKNLLALDALDRWGIPQ